MAVAIATFGITVLILLFGESASKSYAIENTEPWTLAIDRPLQVAELVLFPLVVAFDYLTRAVNRFVGGHTTIQTPYVTRSELRELIRTGE